jgi:polysaccharide chain length determinant protein (PEP-CTERM system associated)
MEDVQVHALDYFSLVRRRKWWLIAPSVASVFVGIALVILLPKQYVSATTLGVSAPTVSPTLVNLSIQLDDQERLRALSQQMLSLPILSRVVREEHLGSGAPNDPDVAKLRKAITVAVAEPVAQAAEPRRLDTFVLSYTDTIPARAQRIANRLATAFVDENSKARATRAEDTSAFIATQLWQSEARLADLEAKLRQAKEAHMGRLPEQTMANLQTLTGLRQQLEANATALHSEQDRLSSAISLPPETRVMTLERELAAARTTYTDKHPEVQRLEEELAEAKRAAAADRSKPTSDRLAQLQLDPAHPQLVADREMTRMRIKELQRAGTDAQRQIAQYQARVDAAPMVEQQLSTFQRDYDLEKKLYSDLSEKLHAATIAESVERNRGGEHFTMLYPASYPTEPTRPVPARVMLMSVLGGICLGGALMLGREYLDRSVHDVRELKDEFDLPVLGEITRIQAA